MPRMAGRVGRFVFNVVSLLSLVMCAAVVTLWAFSYRGVGRYDAWWSVRGGTTVVLGRGRVVWYELRESPLTWDAERVWDFGWSPGDDESVAEFLAAVPGKRLLLFPPPPGSSLEPTHGRGFGGFWFHSHIENGYSRRAVMVPLWFLALATGAAPAYRVLLLRGRRRRQSLARQGQCAGCRYDLRASGDVCPECGLSRGAASERVAPVRRRVAEALAVAAPAAAVVVMALWVLPPTPVVRHPDSPWVREHRYDPDWVAAAGTGPKRLVRRDPWGNEGEQTLWKRGDEELLVVVNCEQSGISGAARVYVFDRDMRLLRRGWSHVGYFDAPLEPEGIQEEPYCLLEVQQVAGGEWDLAVGACRPYFWKEARRVEVGWDRRPEWEALERHVPLAVRKKYANSTTNYVHAVPVEWDEPGAQEAERAAEQANLAALKAEREKEWAAPDAAEAESKAGAEEPAAEDKEDRSEPPREETPKREVPTVDTQPTSDPPPLGGIRWAEPGKPPGGI
jgi:hypothetical protein